MKLSNRKQLLSEADAELKRIKKLNEAPDSANSNRILSVLKQIDKEATGTIEQVFSKLESKHEDKLVKMISPLVVGKTMTYRPGFFRNRVIKSVDGIRITQNDLEKDAEYKSSPYYFDSCSFELKVTWGDNEINWIPIVIVLTSIK